MVAAEDRALLNPDLDEGITDQGQHGMVQQEEEASKSQDLDDASSSNSGNGAGLSRYGKGSSDSSGDNGAGPCDAATSNAGKHALEVDTADSGSGKPGMQPSLSTSETLKRHRSGSSKNVGGGSTQEGKSMADGEDTAKRRLEECDDEDAYEFNEGEELVLQVCVLSPCSI